MARARSSDRFARIRAGLAAVAGLVLAGLLASPADAQTAGWSLCNQTSFVLEAATGRPEGSNVVVEGWRRLRPGECRIAIPAPLRPGVYFAFARSSSAHRGGQRIWPGDVPLCVDPNGSFAVENPAAALDNPAACAGVGLETRFFRAVRIDKSSGGRMTFRETEQYNKPGQSALAAGLQRLLADAGVDADAIDGRLQRRTRTALQTFLQSRNLPATVPDLDLVDILEEVARNRSLDVGLLLCNRTDHQVVAAIARRRPDGWESRGWWTMDAGACARAVDESLLAAPHYIYAEQHAPQGLRKLKGAATAFCAARSRFAILGRDDCARRRYRQEAFLETAPPQDGKLVFEFFDRSFDKPVAP
jgi:uncharacterized membrane protein